MFKKFLKVPISRHVCPSICMEQLSSPCMDFRDTLCYAVLLKYVKKIQVWLKTDKMSGTLHEDLSIFMKIYH
jgi:hypothetical protein